MLELQGFENVLQWLVFQTNRSTSGGEVSGRHLKAREQFIQKYKILESITKLWILWVDYHAQVQDAFREVKGVWEKRLGVPAGAREENLLEASLKNLDFPLDMEGGYWKTKNEEVT